MRKTNLQLDQVWAKLRQILSWQPPWGAKMLLMERKGKGNNGGQGEGEQWRESWVERVGDSELDPPTGWMAG